MCFGIIKIRCIFALTNISSFGIIKIRCIFALTNISKMITKKKIYLKDLAEILSGVYEKTDPDGEIAYLQTKDCTDAVIIKYASRVLLTAKMQKNLLQEGDILFASKGVNYLSVVFREQEKAVASTSFFVIRLKSPIVTSEYLCWFLCQPSVKAYFKSNQAGSATPLIHKPAVENLEIPVPSLEEQKTIVAIARLSKREMELQQAIIEKKQTIVQQLLMNKIK